jgi:hypothetical protein
VLLRRVLVGWEGGPAAPDDGVELGHDGAAGHGERRDRDTLEC